MSKTSKKTAKSKPKKKTASPKGAAPKSRLGRGLSALMEDVRMDDMMGDDVSMIVDIADSPDPIQDSAQADRETVAAQTPELDTPEPEISEPEISEPETPDTDHNPHAAFRSFGSPDPIEPKPAKPISNFRPQYEKHQDDIYTQTGVNYVELGQLVRNPEQPRRHFDETQLQELADSIRRKGILQPILVRPVPSSDWRSKPVYQIVAGERRWQAAGLAALTEIPVFIREITDEEALEIGVIENVQRADLNPMEEALAYKALTSEFGRTQAEVAEVIGKSRAYITNMMRLLSLPEKVQGYLAESRLTIGHARAIVAASDPEALADIILEKKLSVREAEDWVRRLKTEGGAQKTSPRAANDPNARALEAKLTDALGLKVMLKHTGPNGEIRIKYKTDAQYQALVDKLLG